MKSFKTSYKKVTRYILDKLYLYLGIKLNIEIESILFDWNLIDL